ncbi:seryl-tRNA synthetase [Polyplosphaeria fusca]|uniref:serine--tRNA ligase n=1 Tax=Polyplosphaeria fusca TaxID=682080 RepID=A0A9P4QPE1_9PLEO|nr:seryl-tRNA synthetase [Polyplosphaeria fusca]
MPAPKQRKIAIVGSRSVGKSSLTVQFVDGHFVESYYPTIENTFSKVIRYKNQDFATEIIDTAGQDEYSILNSKHFIGIHGYMIVYSVASKQSFEMARIIRDKILNHLGTEWVPLVIVGNKSDLRPEQRQVTPEEGKALAEEFKCAWTEASARYNENVQKGFDNIIAEIEKSQNPAQYAATQIGADANALQKQIGPLKKKGENADDLLKQIAELREQKKAKEDEAAEQLVKLNIKVKSVGNYVHPDVPISGTEDDNVVYRKWSPDGQDPKHMTDGIPHHGVLTRIDGWESDRAVKLVGHRGYMLKGIGWDLNNALIRYGMDFLEDKGYTKGQPPYFMLRDQMAKTAQLSDFDEELYKVSEGNDKPELDKYLIATSEQPLSVLHSEEWLGEKELPIKYAGFSTNFRKEAGSHGKDAWGIFRIHQFEKVEQFLLTSPEKSWQAFDDMISISEEFYKSLGIPFHIIGIVSGALNNAASKKQDLEAWFPVTGGGEYKELVSCSNCTDYQARELEIRFGVKKQTATKKEYVHALNGTLCATERTLCCLLENCQTPEGVVVPEVLRDYIKGRPDFIPYTKEWKNPGDGKKALPDRTK